MAPASIKNIQSFTPILRHNFSLSNSRNVIRNQQSDKTFLQNLTNRIEQYTSK